MGLRGPGAKPVATAGARRRARRKQAPWDLPGLSRSQRVIAFIQSLQITSGPDAGKRFLLRPWQKQFIEAVYGPTTPEGRRVVRTALLTMGRKNGKTFLAAALCLCHLAGPEAEQRGQAYSAAADRNQASLIFREMEAFIIAAPDLAARCNVQRFAKRIEVLSGQGSGSIYEAMSSDARKAHGLSPTFVVCDELAQWPSRELYDNLVTGTGARAEPLVIVISTQSSDPTHIMSEMVEDGRRVAAGEVDDPTFRAFIYETPLSDDPWDEANWYKSNPALGDFRSLEEMRTSAQQAKRIPAREAAFRNLYLNQPVSPVESAIPRADWDACAESVDVASLRGRGCYIGLDLSERVDLTAMVAVFPSDDGSFDVLPFFWLPVADLEEKERHDRVPYREWARAGHLITTPGRTIRPDYVMRQIGELLAEYDVMAVGYDRQFIKRIQAVADDLGLWVPWVEVGQGYIGMAPCVNALEAAVLNHRLRHGGHPILRWNAANAMVSTDAAGNRKYDKGHESHKRIDGIVALAMALNLASPGGSAGPSIYDIEAGAHGTQTDNEAERAAQGSY